MNQVSSACSEEPDTPTMNLTPLSLVWNKEPKERTRADVELLAQTFALNKFFSQKRHELEEKTINYLYRNLRLMKSPAKEIVVNYGDHGDLFYIIFEGEVIVRVPHPFTLENEQFTPIGLLMILIEHFKDVIW